MKYFWYIILAILASSCSTTRNPFYIDQNNTGLDRPISTNQEQVHTLYLIGDTGDKIKGEPNFVLPALQKMLKEESKNSSIVFLGNQIFHKGLSDESSDRRAEDEAILKEQLDILKDFKGDSYFIPGDKDWNNGNAGGRKAILEQEKFIESYFEDRKNVHLYPGKACADPEVVKVDKDLVFVFIDSQWWLQDWSLEENFNRGCDIESRYDFIKSIQEIFVKYKNDEIVLMMHHPVQSNGVHGGHLSARHHFFPFRESHGIDIPMPIVGSFVALYRNIKGGRQDIINDRYQDLVQEINQMALGMRINVTFASAHDNGLQYFDQQKLQYIISGSGSRTNRTVRGDGASFSMQARGFCKVHFYKAMEAWLEFYTVAGPGEAAQLIYRKQIREPKPGSVEEEVKYPPVTQTDTVITASDEFEAKGFKELMLGEQYRDVWSTPVKARLIDLEKEKGGLVPVKKGGGMASNSLRMEADNGKQYILRSIKKDYRKLVPSEFSNLKIINLMKDQNSASHPYGAITLPPLSRAAGIYYTAPELVYLKHQRGLGNYNSQFPEELYLLEERPDSDWSDASQFGNSKEIISYNDLLEILREKKNHFVDQEWVARNRLFDLWIHDWDRHDDQWRWASFEEDDKTVYRAIPRDRDQVYYKFEGLLPAYVAAFFVKKFKTMKADLKDVKNQSFNARYFDRYFLNDLEWSEWEPIIADLQKNLTDEVIDEAMKEFPAEIQEGPEDDEIAELLKARRGNLKKIGKRLYDFISKEVEITGTNDKDRFEVSIYDNGNVRVQMYVLRKNKGDLLKFDRIFYPKETREVRLYGLRGKDDFNIQGAASTPIRIRIIGGVDEDEVENKTKNSRIWVYDKPDGMEFEGNKVINKTSNDLNVNNYNRTGFRYNLSSILPYLGFTIDDGFWFGGSTTQTINRWRKDPYQARHTFYARIAPTSQNAYQIGYRAHIPKVIGLDFAPNIQVDFPRYENYFGLGNESINQRGSIQYNWVRMGSVEISPLLSISSKNNATSFKFGPTFESHRIRNVEGRISDDEVLGFTDDEFRRRNYLGGKASFQSGFQDDPVFTTYGFQLSTSFSYLNENSKEEEVMEFSAAMTTYLPLSRSPEIVLANQVGYRRSWGDLQFYQYADLGNFTNLRGFRNNRFRGESAFYHNIDLRMFLFKWNNTIAPMDIGILGGYDYGRVWLEGEESDTWHNTQTVGIWLNLLDAIILQPYFSFTEELDLFSFKVGFNF